MYTPAGQLAAWFAAAPHGAVTRYASAAGQLDQREPTCKLVRQWLAEGEVEPHLAYLEEVGGEREKCRVIRRVRRAKVGQGGEPAARRVLASDEWRETPQGRVFLEVVRAANFGRACPSNAELAKAAGLSKPDDARYQLRLLSQNRPGAPARIRIEHGGPGNTERRVLVLETGRWTK